MIIASIILAGGQGSRLGREKYAEVIAGKSLIERVVDQLSSLSSEILIVISRRQSKASFYYPETKVITDLYPEKGSLGGIYTGILSSTCFHNLVVACDMPFLNPGLLRYMIHLSSDFDAVIPTIGEHMEPLHSIYSKNCLDPIQKLLKQGELRITKIFDSIRVRYLKENELDRFDPEHLSFFNINTQSDLKKARILIERAFP